MLIVPNAVLFILLYLLKFFNSNRYYNKKDEPTHWINEWIRPNVDSFFLIIAALPCIVMYCDVKSWCTFDVNDVQTPYFFWSIRPHFVRKKPLWTLDHLVCFFQISLDILDIFASFDPAIWIYRLCDGSCTKCYTDFFRAFMKSCSV